MKKWMQSTRTSLILICIFLLIVLLSINMGYFDRQLSQNDDAKQEKNEQIGLYSQLAMTSGNLSYYMRTYVTMGDIEYFKCYWNLKKGPNGRQDLLKTLAAHEHSRKEREKSAVLKENCEKLQEYELFFLRYALKRYQVDASAYEGTQPLKAYIIDTLNYDFTNSEYIDSEADSWQDAFPRYHSIAEEVTKELWELSMITEDRVDELDRHSEKIKRQIFVIQAVSLLLASVCVVLLMMTKTSKVAATFSENTGEMHHTHREQQRDEMLMYFSREYFEVYVVDLSQGSYEIIRSTEQYGSYIRSLTGDFAHLMEMAIVSWTKPPYREIFSQLLNTEEIKQRFAAGEKKIEFVYESYEDQWKRLECFPVPEYGAGNEKMIFAIRDYNEEMQIRTNEVLASEAMNHIYTLVAIRDIEADRYECLHRRLERILDFPEKGIYADLVNAILRNIHEQDIEKFHTELSDERFEREGRAECEYRIRDKKGEYHYYRQYNAKVNMLSGSRMVILIRNIDAFKKHELWKAEQVQKELEMTKLLAEKSKDLEKALLQAESANNAKSKFLSTMSHDLRTPMNVILGMAYLAKKHIGDAAEVDRCLDTILLSSQNMLALINDVLDMNKIESGVIEVREKSGDLVKLIEDLERLIRNRCEENQQIFAIDCNRIVHRYLFMDELRVRQIITNLLSNAVKYTPAFGRISMEVIEQTSRDEGKCSILFIIRDNGIGMSGDFVKRAFEPFEREMTDLSEQIEGTGLGMSITKNLVELMKGTIEIESIVSVGTKITVMLPFKICEEEITGKEIDFAVLQGKYPGKRILIVEDKRMNLEIVKGFLEDAELTVDEARNGREAVDKLRNATEGTYDLVFMDITMPVLRGDEAAMQIRNIDREDCKTIPIIAMTANAMESDVQNSFQCGMNGHISKPIEPKEVYKCLNKWLRE
ncbi:MAG: response regulator [Lachnospiraceae bacterium]